jgi:hypothetical protein
MRCACRSESSFDARSRSPASQSGIHFTNAKVKSATGSMKFIVITIIPIRNILMLFAMLGEELRNVACNTTQLSSQTARAMISFPEYGPMEPPGPLPVAPGTHFPNP